jgi:hypothetical protein
MRLAGVTAALAIPALVACGSGQGHITGGTPTETSPSAGAEPGVETYLCSGSGQDTLLQWRGSSGNLSGTYESAQLSGQAPQEQVSSSSGDLSGTLDGSDITLSIGLSQPLYGTLSGGQLTLNVPQSDGSFQAGTCNHSSLSDWNSTVATLDSQAGSDNQAANQQAAQAQHDQQVSQAQQALSNNGSSLQSDSNTLNNDNSLAGDVKSMQQDYATEQSDYRTEQSDSCDSMGGDADTVGGDADTVGGDLDSLNGDIQTLQSGDIQSIKSDLANVANDLNTLKGLRAPPGTNSSSAVAAGNQALTNAANAVSWAQGQGKIINGGAQQLATTAQNNANSHCG